MLQFWRLDDLQNTGFDRLKLVELFGPVFFEAVGSKAELGNISYNYRFHIVTRLKS